MQTLQMRWIRNRPLARAIYDVGLFPALSALIFVIGTARSSIPPILISLPRDFSILVRARDEPGPQQSWVTRKWKAVADLPS